MVQRIYCRCLMCGKIIMMKYQVGYADFPVVFTCPNCMTEIRGIGKNNDNAFKVSFDFENATIVDELETPDYFLSASRELPTAHIKAYETSDDMAISPFMRLSDELGSLTDESLWKRAGRFSEKELANINRSLDLIKLWEQGKYDILATQLRKELLAQYFPLNNTMEIYRGVHTRFVGFSSDLLPYHWIKEIQTFKKVKNLLTEHSSETMHFIEVFEENDSFKNLEHKLYGAMDYFFRLVGGILPAFLMFDCPNLRFSSNQYAISTISFKDLLEFYQKSYETILEASEVLIALNNISYRNDFDKLAGEQKKTFTERRNDSNKWLRLKQCLIETECFSELVVRMPHNRLRNSIGHFSTEFDGVKQIIQFIDIHNGDKREEKISLIEFAVLCIENFHTCFYLAEVIYQIRKWSFISAGDIPYLGDTTLLPPTHKKKNGRNDPCPCGSGKKYKKCCLLKE